MRVLVTETLSEQGLELLRERLPGRCPDRSRQRRPRRARSRPTTRSSIRSATQVIGRRARRGHEPQGVARAGIGLDNVDVDVGHEAGRDGRQRPAVQHHLRGRADPRTVARPGSQHPPGARRPDRGRWERSKWEGVELAGKTIGLVGLGRVGSLVAARAAGFGMRVIAFDPYVSEERAKEMGVEIMPTLEALLVQSDFVTIHLPRTPETEGLIGTKELRMIKPGAASSTPPEAGSSTRTRSPRRWRTATSAAPRSTSSPIEPTTDSPLFGMTNVVVDAAPRSVHARGAGQGGHDRRRDGSARAERGVRAVRRERLGRRGGLRRPSAPSCRWRSSSAR